MKRLLSLACAAVVISSWAAQSGAKDGRGNPVFVPVKPIVSRPTPPAASLSIGSGRFFTYALPAGWRVGEDGQFAMTLVASDNKALTVMVGNSGFPPN